MSHRDHAPRRDAVRADPPTADRRSPWLARVFWAALAAFIAWDVLVSAPIDLRNEPPLIAAGSGRPSAGGHCSMSK